MRIAIVINTSWNIYNFRKGLIRHLLDNGHEVFAIAPPDEYSSKLTELGCSYLPVALDTKGTSPAHDFSYLLELQRLYRHIKPDVVLHYTIKPNIYGTLAAATLGIPAINNVSGLGTVFLRKNPASRLALWLYRLAFLFPKRVFFQNPHDQSLFIEKKLVSFAITDILPGSGIDLNHFKPVPFRRNPVFTFLLIARLIYDKGIVEYAQAARLLRTKGIQAKFQLLGFYDNSSLGVTPQEVNAWAEEGIIEYLGKTDDVRPDIHRADCVVLPSYREGTPRTLLEAACLAKPLIATRVPGCTEIVKDNLNGFLCEVKNPADLADKMEKMLSLEDKELERLGRNSRLEVESRFDEKEVIRKYDEVLTTLFGREKVFKPLPVSKVLAVLNRE